MFSQKKASEIRRVCVFKEERNVVLHRSENMCRGNKAITPLIKAESQTWLEKKSIRRRKRLLFSLFVDHKGKKVQVRDKLAANVQSLPGDLHT